MTKLLVAILMLLTVSANAKLKAMGRIEATNKQIEKDYLEKPNGTGGTDSYRYSTVKSSLGPVAGGGVEYTLSDKFLIDVNLFLGSIGQLELRPESNLIYKIDDTFSAKAGLNTVLVLSGEYKMTYQPGLGGQVGAEYKFTDKISFEAGYVQTNQTLNRDGYSEGIKVKQHTFYGGAVFRF